MCAGGSPAATPCVMVKPVEKSPDFPLAGTDEPESRLKYRKRYAAQAPGRKRAQPDFHRSAFRLHAMQAAVLHIGRNDRRVSCGAGQPAQEIGLGASHFTDQFKHLLHQPPATGGQIATTSPLLSLRSDRSPGST